MFSFKYELSQMIAREKFTGLSPEIIMEKICCKIWLLHVVLCYRNKYGTSRSGESIDTQKQMMRVLLEALPEIAISNPIWAT